MIVAADEQAHEPGESEHAQESWYFNWADPRHRLFGLARIGYHWRDHQPEPLILTVRAGAPEFFFPTSPLPPMTCPWDQLDAGEGLRAGGMVVIMEEPLRRWRVLLDGPDRMDLTFDAFTPPFDYRGEGRGLAPSMTTEHFEQSCKVTGWTEFRGTHLDIDGLGQRDKSWGVRIWPEIEGWDWISAQFGHDLSFNVMLTRERGTTFTNGFVFRDGRNVAVRQADVRYEWGQAEEQPATTRLRICDETGTEHTITAVTEGIFPIPRRDVRLEEAYSIFTYHGPDGSREGGGVVEHVWRPGAR
jgi:hypothetical protein